MEEYENSLKKLTKQVSQMTSSNILKKKAKMFPTLGIPIYAYYAAIPISIFVVLAITKPRFVSIDTIDLEGEKKKLSYSKLFVVTLIISSVIGISWYAYMFKKNQKISF